MNAKLFIPKNGSNIISQVWELTSDGSEKPIVQVIPPLGAPEIVFYVNKAFQINGVDCQLGFIKGQYSKPRKIELIPGFHLLGIKLHPYGLKQLFNIKADSLTDGIIDAMEHPVTEEMIRIVQSRQEVSLSLVEQLSGMMQLCKQYPVSHETKAFLELVPAFRKNIAQTLEYTGIGLRTLQRKFKDEVGLSPKKYVQIMRMLDIENKTTQTSDWFDIITYYDFVDQSHLIKEFLALRDVTPTEFIRKKIRLSDQLPSPDKLEF